MNRTRTIIGFSAGMGAGKSTAIEYLKEYLKLWQCTENVLNVKFAQPIYDIQEFAYKRIEKVHKRPADFVKDRKLLQWIGTEWGRDSISKTLWVDEWKAEAQKYLYAFDGTRIVTCDDVRFDNEAEVLQKMGGFVIRIECDRALNRIGTANGIANHASEAGVARQYISHVVSNNGTLEDFKKNLQTVFDEIFRAQM